MLYFDETSEASGNEIYVHNGYYAIRDGSAEHPYVTIQYAINLANEGDTVYGLKCVFDRMAAEIDND